MGTLQARTQTFGWGGGQDFEKLDQNFKVPPNRKKGREEGEIYINEYFMMKNVPIRVRFSKKIALL